MMNCHFSTDSINSKLPLRLTVEVTTKTEIVYILNVLNKEDKIASILCQCKQELHNIVFLKFKFMNFISQQAMTLLYKQDLYSLFPSKHP